MLGFFSNIYYHFPRKYGSNFNAKGLQFTCNVKPFPVGKIKKKFNTIHLSSAMSTGLRLIKLSFPFEPAHDKTNNKTCATSEDSDQPAHSRTDQSLR